MEETIQVNKASKPISLKTSEEIVRQMKSCVCKIKKKCVVGTGFFVKIPYKEDNILVLITNNRILGETDIEVEKFISISFENEKVFRNIEIFSERKRYTNEKLDITIIEVFEDVDEIKDFKDFLVLDGQIINILNLEGNENMTNCLNNLSSFSWVLV